ncbi:hypothetical protein ABIA30_002882 [Mycobacterium sp. MAA66]|uniref:hypothetical protein n=1 Tax=Mycobacterium sp. MAA66 TaxID=3156297 RepID=UPI003518A894
MSAPLSDARRVAAVAVLAWAVVVQPVAAASPTTAPATPTAPANPTSTAPATPSASNPATDSQGFVDSSARCSAPDVAVAYGSTDQSKAAICKTPAGQYQYRGVRLRDGAKLVAAAAQNSSGAFVATSDGITYTLTPKSLDITDASGLIRSEPVVYYRGSSTIASTGTTASTPTTGQTAGAPVTPVTGAPTAAPTTPLPPPLPAEVGGKSTGH